MQPDEDSNKKQLVAAPGGLLESIHPRAQNEPGKLWIWFRFAVLPLGACAAFLFPFAWEQSDMSPNIFVACGCWLVLIECLIGIACGIPIISRTRTRYKVLSAIAVPLLLALFFRSWISEKYHAQFPKLVEPKLLLYCKMMPFDPPYRNRTIIGTTQFDTNCLDVRIGVKVTKAPIKSLDMTIRLLNTSGQMLAIETVEQLTPYQGVTIIPVKSPETRTIIWEDASGEKSTLLGKGRTTTWRVLCKDIPVDSTPMFFLMVSKPLHEKMIEGILVTAIYSFDLGGKETQKSWTFPVSFDEQGTQQQMTTNELNAMLKHKNPVIIISNVYVKVGPSPKNTNTSKAPQ